MRLFICTKVHVDVEHDCIVEEMAPGGSEPRVSVRFQVLWNHRRVADWIIRGF